MTEEPRSQEETAISPLDRIIIAAIVLATSALGFAAGRIYFHPVSRVVQPIAFNHQEHTKELELACDTCHEYLSVGHHAGLPSLSTCLMCHEEPQGKNPEEARIRELSASGKQDVFVKLFKLPEHVYYSHRRHAIVAKIPCSNCHGAIAETTTPPISPLVKIDMEFCIDCHHRQSVTAGCTSCHR